MELPNAGFVATEQDVKVGNVVKWLNGFQDAVSQAACGLLALPERCPQMARGPGSIRSKCGLRHLERPARTSSASSSKEPPKPKAIMSFLAAALLTPKCTSQSRVASHWSKPDRQLHRVDLGQELVRSC